MNFILKYLIYELCVWFHTLDHTHYSPWLPVYLRDMHLLATRHPLIKEFKEFKQGRNFVVQQSQHKLSLIVTDQAHEQMNKVLKAGAGNLADLYDKPDALAFNMLSAPDVSRVVETFEKVTRKKQYC